MKPIYTAANAQVAEEALETFAVSDLGIKYPMTVKTFENQWQQFIPFLAFPPALRRVIYTTNATWVAELSVTKSDQEPRPFP